MVPVRAPRRIGRCAASGTLRVVARSEPTSQIPALVLDGITRRFGAREVLQQVSLERREPGIVGLLGANGRGKTTLLRCIAQLVEPDSGSVHVAGVDVTRGDSPEARRLVGWAPHEPLAWRDDSVERNLRYAARLADLSRRKARAVADAAVRLWQLDAVRDEPVRRLSRGWAQRYSLARADLLGPLVLLLDEPTTGLDRDARALLEAALDSWRTDRIVVVASHEREWLMEQADQLLDLDELGSVG